MCTRCLGHFRRSRLTASLVLPCGVRCSLKNVYASKHPPGGRLPGDAARAPESMANYLLVLTHGHNCQREGPARRLLLLWHVRMPWPAPKLGAGIRVRSDVLP